jgi:hypothetical protein
VWRDDDRVTVAVGHSDAGDSEHPTADGPPSAWAKVTVIRADWSGSASRLYVAGEVDEFWSALMCAGPEARPILNVNDGQPAESHGDGAGVAGATNQGPLSAPRTTETGFRARSASSPGEFDGEVAG